MSNKNQFLKSLNARVKIRPMVLHSLYGKYFDEDWIIDSVTNKEFHITHAISGIGITLCHDSKRSWHDLPLKPDGIKRGVIMLNGKIEIDLNNEAKYSPLIQQEINHLMKIKASKRT